MHRYGIIHQDGNLLEFIPQKGTDSPSSRSCCSPKPLAMGRVSEVLFSSMLTGLILCRSYLGCEFMSRRIFSCSDGLISKHFSLNFWLLNYFHCSSTKYSESWGDGLINVSDLWLSTLWAFILWTLFSCGSLY